MMLDQRVDPGRVARRVRRIPQRRPRRQVERAGILRRVDDGEAESCLLAVRDDLPQNGRRVARRKWCVDEGDVPVGIAVRARSPWISTRLPAASPV